jgi:hypothetical protein
MTKIGEFIYNGGEFEDILMDKIYDVEFGMYRIGDYFIEAFPYHVVNRESHIIYKAESLMDAADWADSRYERGGLIKALGLANDNLNKGGLVLFDELSEATTDTLKDAMNKYQQQIEILNKIASPTFVILQNFLD